MINITSVTSSIGIFTHQGHISKVNENVHSVTQSLTHSVTLITSRASSDAKKMLQCKVSEPEQAELGLVMGWRILKTTARITLSKEPSFGNF